jgi:hypothetical protein
MIRVALLLLSLLSAGQVAAAQDVPYGGSHSFAAYRNGQRIGTHTVEFRRDGDRLAVATSIDLAVKFAGFTAYRYSHRSRELWRGDELLTLESTTNDDGKPYSVKASGETLPPGILPSSHWRLQQTAQSQLLNSQKGTIEPIRATVVGRETVRTATGMVPATRYRYDGGIRMDQWYDDRGRWVKTTFTASDGSLIEYVLQE